MAPFCSKCMLFFVAFALGVCIASLHAKHSNELSLEHYDKSCPNAQYIVRKEVECAVRENRRNAAILIRLHFHDCFVQGCDGSVLLDDTATLIGEKQADQNVNSLKGFDLIDKIKAKLEAECPGVVSCADVLAIAARDGTELVGGPYWDVPVGRLDSKTASLDQANKDIPGAQQSLVTIAAKFLEKGLSIQDMVALVGAHTVGMSRCVNFRDRLYGAFQMTTKYEFTSQSHLSKLKDTCPSDGGDDNTFPMDYYSPNLFDNAFYETLLKGTGLLSSDQEMYSSLVAHQTSEIVDKYWANSFSFFRDFADSMVKMGNITGSKQGEVRKNCRYVNI